MPDVVAGRDRTAGGTWMALNRHGVVAAVLNRPGSLGPAPGKRSRGELPLRAAAELTAAAAAVAISQLDAGQWRSFNLVLADATGALFVRGLAHGAPQVVRLAPGLHMITAHDPNDPESPRVARHRARFAAAPAPGEHSITAPLPRDEWRTWQSLVADRSGDAGEQLNVVPRGGFGTVCASLLAIPAAGPPEWLFAAGPPHAAPFQPVALPWFARAATPSA